MGGIILQFPFCSWQGDLFDHEGLVKAMKKVDIVISAVGKDHLADQEKLIPAIKAAGNIKVIIDSSRIKQSD